MSYSRTANNDVETLARSTAAQVADKASELANKASHQLDKALDSAEATAANVAQTGREAGERVSEVAGNLRSAVDKSVADQPMTTLLVAAGIGFVIGAIWKS